MYFSWHFSLSLAISIVLSFYVNILFAVVFFLGSVGIDVDHYFYYLFVLRKKNPKRMIEEWHDLIKKKDDPMILVFHNIEVLALLFLVVLLISHLRVLSLPLFFGVLVHFLCDKIWDLTTKEHLKKRYWSALFWMRMKYKNRGGPAGV